MLRQRLPAEPGAPLLSADLLWGSLLQGGLVMGVIGGFYMWLLNQTTPEAAARTAAFVALVGANVALIVSNRSVGNHLLESLRRPNRALWTMLGVTTALLTLVLGWPARGGVSVAQTVSNSGPQPRACTAPASSRIKNKALSP